MGRWKSDGSRGKHQTVHRDLRPVMAWLDDQAEVRKVVLGQYRPGGGRGGRTAGCLVFRSETPTAVRVYATTGDGLLELLLLVDPANRPAFLAKLARRFPRYADRLSDPRRRPQILPPGVLC